MYIINVTDKSNFHTNNIGTFHLMRQFLYEQDVNFKAFYESGEECKIRSKPSDANRTFSHVDHKPMIRLAAGLGMRDQMIEFLIKYAAKHKSRIVTI